MALRSTYLLGRLRGRVLRLGAQGGGVLRPTPSLFKEKASSNREVALSFRENVLSKGGGTEHPDGALRVFPRPQA